MAKFSYSAIEKGTGTDASFGVVEAPRAEKARRVVSDILRARKQSGFSKPRARYTVTLEQRNSGAGRRNAGDKFYTLTRFDVGHKTIKAFGRRWPVEDFIGRVLASDVGKRVYRSGDVLSVENDEQMARRRGRKNPAHKSVTLRNMASVTVTRLPGGAVAVTGRKLAGARANPGERHWYYEITTEGRHGSRIMMNVIVGSLEDARRGARQLAKRDGKSMYIERVSARGRSTHVETVRP